MSEKNMLHIFYFLICIISYTSCIRPQRINKVHHTFPDPVFEHLTVADGLPENSIRYIFQDHFGYMWFGTQNGLVQYDGYNMKVYQSVYSDSLTLSDAMPSALFEDDRGNMWVGTFTSGINRFNRASGTFTRFLHNPEDSSSINSDYVDCISEDKDGNILIGNRAGLDVFNPESNKFKHIHYRGQVFSKKVYTYIKSLRKEGKTICSLLNVGLITNLKKRFRVDQKTIVLVISMGQSGQYDGWVEKLKSKVSENTSDEYKMYAGGFLANKVRIHIDTLDAGEYSLHYVANETSSYHDWVLSIPDYPDLWGIQVIDVGHNVKDLKKLLNYEKYGNLKYPVNDIISDKVTKRIFVAIDDNILMSYDKKNGLKRLNFKSNAAANEIGVIRSFYQSSDGTIWIAHSMGLGKFDPAENIFTNYHQGKSRHYEKENDFDWLTGDDNGVIWGVCAVEGKDLVYFDPVQRKFKRYAQEGNNPQSTNNQNVLSVYKDRSGIIWIGTLGDGLNKWDQKKQKLKHYTYHSEDTSLNPFKNVFAISEDQKGTIWLGTDNGLYSYSLNRDKYRHINNSSIRNKSITCMYIDNYGIIWMGTKNGLGRFDPAYGTCRFYKNNPLDSTTIPPFTVTTMIPGRDENYLWVGTLHGGLSRVNKITGKFTHYKNNSNELFSDQIVNLYRDRSGNIWVGTNKGGLFLFNPSDKTFTLVRIKDTGEKLTAVTALYEDTKGNLWVGTYRHGIYLYDRKKRTSLYNISSGDGLGNDIVCSIFEDSKAHIWISTENGLSEFNPENHSIKNFSVPDGFNSNRYENASCLKTPDGEVLLGSHDGFVIFNPDDIKDDTIPPQVVISNVSLFNDPQRIQISNGYIPELKELDLAYDQNDLRFDYVGLQYAEPEKNRYRYRLNGFDKDWVDAGTQRNAIYTNLDAGEYIFQVTACNSDGIWNKQGASIKIIIPPPYWESWWAYLLYISFGLLLMYNIRRYELNRSNLKNQVKLDQVKLKEREETDRMKSRFFANISHEFRTPLTLISGPIEKITFTHPDKETLKQAGLIKRNVKRLLGLINQLLDLSKLEAGKLHLRLASGNIVSFVKGITMSFESFAENKDIALKVKSIRNEIEGYFDREIMYKVLSNLLSNAFKFTGDGGEINVSIEEIPEKSVRIIVKDSGRGISEYELPKLFDRFYQVDSSQTREHEGTGIGLALTKELIELHHGRIEVKSWLNEGSEFIVEIPIGRNSYSENEVITSEETESDLLLSNMEDSGSLITGQDIAVLTAQPDDPGSQGEAEWRDDGTVILVVEDNADVREFIKDSLGDSFRYEEAMNGEQGLRKAEQIIPDLIISDIMMPKIDGNELVKRIKNDEKTSHIPVILLTAKSAMENRLEGLKSGADDYLTKPFDTKELLIRINNIINLRRKLQEKYSSKRFEPVRIKDVKKLSNLEERFMSKVTHIIDEHYYEEEFSVEEFGRKMGMSRVQLHRKLKALTGKSASVFLRTARLSKARKLLEDQKGNVSEIAYMVGFSSPQYFTKCFKDEFGYPPGELKK